MKTFILKNWPKLLKYLLGPLLLVILFWTIGIKQVWVLLTTTNLKYFTIAYIFFILSVFIAAMNIYILFFPLKKIDPKRFLQYFLASRITSLIFPGRLGEFSLSYYLHKEDINLGRGIAAVITDKLITVSCSMILGLIAIFIFMKGMRITTVAAYIVIMITLFALLLSSVSRKLIKRWILRKYAYHFEGFSKTLFSYVRENKEMTILNTFLTLVRIVVIALSEKAMFLALGTNISLLTLILVGGLETLSVSIPLTINGLGIKQAIGIYIFSTIGVSPTITAARYLIGLFIQYSFGFISTFFIENDFFIDKKETNT